jgi:hypothetical protein
VEFHTGAQLAVFFVSTIAAARGERINGQTLGNRTLISTSYQKQEKHITLAQEITHFLCKTPDDDDHDPGADSLMFKTAPHGTRMRKDRILKIPR